MEKVYKDILDATGAGYWDWDITNNQVIVSDSFKSMMGYDGEDIASTRETMSQLIHEDDVDLFFVNFEKHVANKGATPLKMVLRFFHKLGEIVYTECNATVIEWEEIGEPKRMVGSFINVTVAKKLEHKLMRVQNLLLKTNEAARVGGWEIDLVTGKISWTKITRIIHEVDDDFEPSFEAAVGFFTPSSRAKVEEAFKEAVANNKSYDLELEMITAKGNKIWARALGYPERKMGKCIKVLGAFQDITQIKEAEEALRLKKEQLGHFIAYSPAAMAMFDNKMQYIAASNNWMTSYKLDGEIIGESHYEIFPEVSDDWKDFHQRCLGGETIKCDGESFERADGSTDWLRWEIRPWYDTPGVVGGIVMLTEVITERVEAKAVLLKAKEAAELASEAKSQFLSTMSHEIRTPMNAVIGLTHILLDNPRPDQVENLRTLKFSAENLLVLINDILDFSKIEAGKIEFEQAHFSIKEVLSNIRLSLLSQANTKGIQLKLMVDDELPKMFVGDPVRVGQIFTNLIANAIKFTSEGKVTISATLRSKSDNNALIDFEISDTGIGIAKDKQELIFESFSQANPYIARKYGGTGLGLAITTRLLELMGSKIKLESELDKGSTFSFMLSLPISDKVADVNVNLNGENSGRVYQSFEGFKVLLAEDNAINVLVAKQFFKRWNIEWDLAENGLIAIDLIKLNNYDLVLMDLHMPELDGYSAVEIIRGLEGEKYQSLPIIALTASASISEKDRTKTSGLNAYITKPFNPDELYDAFVKYYAAKPKSKVN